MNEQTHDSLEKRSRVLFDESVASLDMRMRSRLTQARHAALDAASAGGFAWFLGLEKWKPTVGVAAAAMLGAALWFGSPIGHHAMTSSDGQSNLEDLEIVASTDDASADPMEMLQDDIDFYDFADKAGSDTAA
jgi:hypothetical protein